MSDYTFSNTADSTTASTQVNGGANYWGATVTPAASTQTLKIPASGKYFDKNIIVTFTGMTANALSPSTDYYSTTATSYGSLGAGYLKQTYYIKAGGDTFYATTSNGITNCISGTTYENTAGWVTSGAHTAYITGATLQGTVASLALNGGTITAASGTGTISTLSGTLTVSNNGTSTTASVINIPTNTYGTINVWSGKTADHGVTIANHVVTVDGDGSKAGTAVTDSSGDLITTSVTGAGGAVSGSVTDIEGSSIDLSYGTDTYSCGIAVTAKASASKAAITYTNSTAGWLSAHTSATTLISADSTATTLTSRTEYVTGLTIASGKTFGSSSVNAITVAGTAYESVTGTIYARTSGTANVTFPTSGSGTVAVAGTTVAQNGALITASPSFDGGTVSGSVTDITGSSISVDTTDTYGCEIAVTAQASASRAAVLYNGAAKGWVDIADNTSALSAGSSTSLTSRTEYVTGLTIASGKTFGSSSVNAITIAGTAYEAVTGTARINLTSTASPKTGTVYIGSTKVADGGTLLYGTLAAATESQCVTKDTALHNANGTVQTNDSGATVTATADGIYSGYTEVSNIVLSSNGYLIIGSGWYANTKISLKSLVPDEANITGATGAAYILNGKIAYDADGNKISGTIGTYQGAYTLV